jgi:hypothetical protein
MTVRRGIRTSPALGWVAVAAAGLILVLVVAQGPPSGPTSGRPAVRLMVSIPAPLEVVILGLFALVALFVLWLLMPRHLRRRKKDPDTIEMVYENPKVSPWVAVALLTLSAAPLVLMGYLLWRGWSPFGERVARLLSAPGLPAPAAPPVQGPFVPEASSPWFSGAVTILALAVGVGCLALALWILFGDRMIGSWEGLKPRSSEGLLEAIDDSLEALRREADARRAIVRCYRRFEHAVTRRGLPRKPWETPMEFMQKALGRLPLAPDVVGTLIDLFHLARFSDHPLGTRERDLAVDSLVEIRAALEGERENASAT